MNRRSFMGSILAAGVAPWVVTSAGVLMPVRSVRERFAISPSWVWVPGLGTFDTIAQAQSRMSENPGFTIVVVCAEKFVPTFETRGMWWLASA